ncbi:hypothetical protein MLD38_000373 [Melastoma candidum]|uniref:Uncharacterized protein n=1 Tax=Melastoma candidum TaxID=119954 RepID=A0ACB9SDT0_9MYRT|nr:hypothetical protein MLD38_000373 [Melastoma candidum]
MMAMRKLLLFLKPLDDYATSGSSTAAVHPQVLKHLSSRRRAHSDAIRYCQDVLLRKAVEWEAVSRNDLSRPVRDVDMVLSIGGDGTLLRASHFVDDSVPILGVNSDPSVAEEIEQFTNEFDASRSTGFLCAASLDNFEQVIDGILEVSRFSLRVHRSSSSAQTNCRSSGLRVSTSAGSTAAMLSAGGHRMPILSRDLQYMVREPISPGKASSLMHGFVSPNESMEVGWSCDKGVIYVDGCHVRFPIKLGDRVQIASSSAPVLKVYLPSRLLSIGKSRY